MLDRRTWCRLAGLAAGSTWLGSTGSAAPRGRVPGARESAAAGHAQAPGASAALHAMFDREWEWELAQDPIAATYLGDARWNDRWPDLTLEAFEQRQRHREGVLRELASIARDRLSAADQTHFDVFRYQVAMAVEGFQYRYHLVRTNTYDGVQNSEQIVDAIQFRALRDYEDWLARLDAFPAFIDQNIGLMREGMRTNVLLPKVIMLRVRDQLSGMIAAAPRASGFYRPFAGIAATVAAAERGRLADAGLDRVRARVQPALERLRDFIDRDYMPAAYDRAGWWQTSSGQAGYAYLARYHTTTALGPEAIHAIGLQEVARIRGEMDEVRKSVGFAGTLDEFFAHLRTDPAFFFKTSDELLAAYRALAKRIDPELVKISRRLPRTPYGVLPIPDAVAPNTTTAYANFPAADGSRPAYYFVNLYKPETRPKWEMLALTLHEAMPGHCLQGAIALELDMPAFRRNAGFTAYVEGWGLYAESLGREMGLYQDDPYARFGQLTYQMWRAVRLVVDTGMHAMQWDRARAIRYFMENAARTELDVTNEIDRYISWPGQALAYKIGELKIQDLRRAAEAALGARFDIRDFDDVVLQTGAVPLDVLARLVGEWVRGR
ncbi:MAG: DUF885 domain-containing protein [Acidobacteria bacterium]|nr:DUF885 domain-containing protein [Acidobacteriota bacterium]